MAGRRENDAGAVLTPFLDDWSTLASEQRRWLQVAGDEEMSAQFCFPDPPIIWIHTFLPFLGEAPISGADGAGA